MNYFNIFMPIMPIMPLLCRYMDGRLEGCRANNTRKNGMRIKVRSRGELNGKNNPSFEGNHWPGPTHSLGRRSRRRHELYARCTPFHTITNPPPTYSLPLLAASASWVKLSPGSTVVLFSCMFQHCHCIVWVHFSLVLWQDSH